METIMEWLPIVGHGFIGGLVVWLGPRAFTFLRAVTSGWNKENVKDRLAICKECPRVKAKDYVDPDGALTTFLYCDECKCGSHHIAELHTKLGFYDIRCPMGKFGKIGAMTVHEGHDLLIERGRKERAEDQRERTNIMAGRDRDDDGKPGDNGKHPGSRTAQAQAQLRPTDDAVQAQRTRIQKAREATAARQALNIARVAADHADRTNKIWGDSKAATAIGEETNNPAPLAGRDHEGQILVDQKESSDGEHSLDKRNG